MINKRFRKRVLAVLSALCLVTNTYGATALAAAAEPAGQTVNASDDNDQKEQIQNEDQTQTEPSDQKDEDQGGLEGGNLPDDLGGGETTI